MAMDEMLEAVGLKGQSHTIIPTFMITKDFRFEAAHQLPNHDGKCRRLHGHSYTATVIIKANFVNLTGPKEGMVIDYSDMSTAMEPLLEDKLDHHFLNETLDVLPTAENIARYIYTELKLMFGPALHAVKVKETENTEALYMEHLEPAQ